MASKDYLCFFPNNIKLDVVGCQQVDTGSLKKTTISP